jgi:[ribosomal protein S18]-alanine N-acetyltransferase
VTRASGQSDDSGVDSGDDSGGDPIVVLTPMRRRHLRAVLRIEGLSQTSGWSLGLFLGELARPEGRSYLVAKVGSQVVGFAGMLFIGDEGHIATISVDPAWRRRGIATRLVAALCRQAIDQGAKAFTLEVRAGGTGAQALYRAFGFAPAGVRRNYYKESGEDAIVMWAHDVDSPAYDERLRTLEAPTAATTRLDSVGRR